MTDPVTKAAKSTARNQRHLTRFAQHGKDILEEDVSALTDHTDIDAALEKTRSAHVCIADEVKTMTKSVEDLEQAIEDNPDTTTQEQQEAFDAFDNMVADMKQVVSRLDARISRLVEFKKTINLVRNPFEPLERQSSPASSIQLDTPLFRPGTNISNSDPQPSTQFPAVPVRSEGGVQIPDSVASTQTRDTVTATPLNQLTLGDFADLLSRLPNSAQPTGHTSNQGFGYKIPKFTLPSFDGKPEEWKPFWDRFERAIHRNPTIADADKLSYLMSYMRGEAQMLINDMPLTNENYQVALRQLRDNFGDPKIAIEKVRQQLRDLPLVASSNFQKFKEFFFIFEQLAKRLEHLGGDVNNEHLVDIILDKLPRFITDKVERAKDDDDDWSMSRLRNLLAKELKTEGKIERRMERRSILLKTTQPKHDDMSDQRRNPPQRKLTTDSFASAEQQDSSRPTHPCLFCNGDHWMNECNQYRTARARTERAKYLRLCFICLQKDHQAKNCTYTNTCSHCRQTGRHHSALCPKRFPDRFPGVEHGHYGDEAEVRDLTKPDEQGALGDDEQTVMKTAQIVAVNPADVSQKIRIRAYLDNGTSRTFLSERAAEALNLPMGPKKTLRIKRFGNDIKPHTIEYRPAFLILKSITGEKMKISVAVTSQTMSSINKVAVPVEIARTIPREIVLADEPASVNTQLQVDMMLGNDYYDDVITGKKTQLSPGFWLLDSDFGWIVSGRVSEDYRNTEIRQLMCNDMGMQVVDNDVKLQACSFASSDLPGSLEDLWNLEVIGIREEQNPISDDDALEQFNKTVKFVDGHYQVTFPWNSNKGMLPDNRNLASRRLFSLVQRMQRLNRHQFLVKYDQVIKDQLLKGVIEVVDDESTLNTMHYLPHHGVETPQKATTKLRIVYDASAKESSNVPSLNDCIHRGQVFLENLLALLFRFRLHRVAIIADLEKAFLQVGLQRQERDVTRFLWIKDLSKPATPDNIICLRFARVLFGVNASPFLLGATVAHHLNHHPSPIAKQIGQNIYSDNVITGACNINEADHFYKESKQLFIKAGMNLREFASNNEEFLSHIPEVDRIRCDTTKVLGILWQRSTDQLHIQLPDEFPINITKKILLSTLFKVYDPLGFVCPITIRGKMLLQTLCKKKVAWNEVVAQEDIDSWVSLTADLQQIGAIRVPRYLGFDISESSRLMCFVDASENAYAALIYILDDTTKSHLLFAKARVSPLKKKSIPRLELMAVLIGVRAVGFVREKLGFNGRVVLWSDSQCVLRWLQTKKVTGTFVTNRLKEIRKEKDIEFRYVPSKENPADIASRGGSYTDLTGFWWNGPH